MISAEPTTHLRELAVRACQEWPLFLGFTVCNDRVLISMEGLSVWPLHRIQVPRSEAYDIVGQLEILIAAPCTYL